MSDFLLKRMNDNISFISEKENEFYNCKTFVEKEIVLNSISKCLDKMMFECATTHIPIKKRTDYFFGERIFKRLNVEFLDMKKQEKENQSED